jgi:hypothetical protein
VTAQADWLGCARWRLSSRGSAFTYNWPVPTTAQKALIDRAREVAEQDPRVLGAWIVGSLATGSDDEWSDVDLHLLVSDHDLDAFPRVWAEIIERIGPMVMIRQIGNIAGGYAITPEWMHLDVVCHAASSYNPAARRGGYWPLFDRTGRLPVERSHGPDPHGDPYFPAEAVDFYYYLLGNLAVVLGRGELTLATNGAIMRRDMGLIPLMLAENGVRKNDGNKRLQPYLTDDQNAFLGTLPPLAQTRDSVIAFDRLVAAEMSRRGRALATVTGAEWPTSFEHATLAYLRRELGMDLPA